MRRAGQNQRCAAGWEAIEPLEARAFMSASPLGAAGPDEAFLHANGLTFTGSPIEFAAPLADLSTLATAASANSSARSLLNLDRYRADSRFANLDGRGFTSVVLDTGINRKHPFFGADANRDGTADRIVYQYDFADNDADASDRDGHGSNVASIVASQDATYSGVAPGVNIIALKVFTDKGSGNFGYVERALQWVVANQAKYNIVSVNLSLGDSGLYNAPQRLYGISDEIAALAAKNVIVAAAAGNSYYDLGSKQGVGYPAADPNSIAVGAVYAANVGGFSYGGGAKAFTTGADRLAPFSQRSGTMNEVFAPGAPMTGAAATGTGTITMHGTSQATPQITGIVALADAVSTKFLGRKLSLAEFRTLFATTSATITDGDDENDNTKHTGLKFKRVDMLALAQGIINLAAKPAGLSPSAPPPTPLPPAPGPGSLGKRDLAAFGGDAPAAAPAFSLFATSLPRGGLSMGLGSADNEPTASVLSARTIFDAGDVLLRTA